MTFATFMLPEVPSNAPFSLAPATVVDSWPTRVRQRIWRRWDRVGRWKKRTLGLFALLLSAFVGGALFVPGFLPATVDAVRAVVGPKVIAATEDTVYGWKDRWESFRHKDDKPTEYWDVPPQGPGQSMPAPQANLQVPSARPPIVNSGTAPSGPPMLASGTSPGGPPMIASGTAPSGPPMLASGTAPSGPPNGASTFPPPPFAPPHAKVAAANDGIWFPVADDVAPNDVPVFAKALVHPDSNRPYSAVAVLAIDATRTHLEAVAGTSEPENPAISKERRGGRVPAASHSQLVAAFNGGWQAVHGHFGMMVEGLEILPPRDGSCTVALFKDGSLAIGTWSKLASRRSEMKSFRQTPRCLAEAGESSARLSDEARGWGTSVDGDTMIRRSAIGLSGDKKTLFYAVGDSQSAKTIADALTAAGAVDVAMLDVNASFPRFLFYTHAEGNSSPPRVAGSLIPAEYKPTEYVERSWYRDFFYIKRR